MPALGCQEKSQGCRIGAYCAAGKSAYRISAVISVETAEHPRQVSGSAECGSIESMSCRYQIPQAVESKGLHLSVG